MQIRKMQVSKIQQGLSYSREEKQCWIYFHLKIFMAMYNFWARTYDIISS